MIWGFDKSANPLIFFIWFWIWIFNKGILEFGICQIQSRWQSLEILKFIYLDGKHSNLDIFLLIIPTSIHRQQEFLTYEWLLFRLHGFYSCKMNLSELDLRIWIWLDLSPLGGIWFRIDLKTVWIWFDPKNRNGFWNFTNLC